MFIPIFTISPLIFIVGFTIFGKAKKTQKPKRPVEPQIRIGGAAVDFELLFFTSSIDSALTLERTRRAPIQIGAAATNTPVLGNRLGI
jgi:hypothetical protein